MLFTISKINLFNFLEELAKAMPLYAPVNEEGIVRFKKIQNPMFIDLKEKPYYPIKSFFHKPKCVLFKFSHGSVEEPQLPSEERAFFGVRRCDLTALAHQELIFHGEDAAFTAERDRTLLMGYHCFSAMDEFCFCGDFKMKDNFDLMFYDEGEFLVVETGSIKGERLAKRYTRYFKPRPGSVWENEKKTANAQKLKTKDIEGLYDNPKWFDGIKLCLSCTACTTTCPTCYCFSIKDEVAISDNKKGQRIREWSSCQLENFTRVAGNHTFRKERFERFKHRIYHQMVYFKEEYGEPLCVGCGRCIRSCPTRIDWVKIINSMVTK